MDFGTVKMIEFFLFFGGGLAFCVHQLWSLRCDEKRRLKAEAEAMARGEPPPPPPPIPGWMADRSNRPRPHEDRANTCMPQGIGPPEASASAATRLPHRAAP